ncbi:hypothetical protein GCM10023322_64260 [Rugosimonospora acidiphila]|uniref:Uncharacterized protein n=1 Tax=Rugosimonospora acidiphila TaxID=556531 RepID=A0ABP9SJH0_9ACTN
MLDENLHSAFADAVRDTPPQTSDPYDRLIRRARRGRRVRLALGGSGLVAAALATLAIVPVAHPAGTGSIAYAGGPVMSDWARRLIASPTRGDLSDDAGYLAEFTGIAARHRADWQVAPNLTAVKVLYAGDDSGTRVVLLVFSNTDRAVFVWFSAPKGAPASLLAKRPTLSNDLEPFATVSYSARPYADKDTTRFTIGLAPAGCRIDSSSDAAHQAWVPVPTGSFAALDTATSAQWWRVTCDGVVHYLGPAEGSGVYLLPTVTDSQLAEALTGARGTVDRDVARFAVSGLEPGTGPVLTTGTPRVLWGGSVPGEQSDPAVVAAAPLANGRGWYVYFETYNPKAPGGAAARTSFKVGTRVALDDPRSLFGLRTADARSNPTDQILVLAPRDAVSAIAVTAGGDRVADVRLTDGIGWLTSTPRTPVTLQALGAKGTVIASYPLDSPSDASVADVAPTIDNW